MDEAASVRRREQVAVRANVRCQRCSGEDIVVSTYEDESAGGGSTSFRVVLAGCVSERFRRVKVIGTWQGLEEFRISRQLQAV